MALNASTNWYVRAGGNALNGGGWDAAIAGAGVNYADADAAILSPTDLATSGAVATVTSAAGGFTANMVGNCLRIASGTNFTPGYYFIVTFTDANTVVLDRACATAAGSGGTGRIGGAFATPWGNLANGGTTPAPTITTPLAPGHTVCIRGAGADPPSSPDYTMPSGYATYPNGSAAVGPVRFIGVNGRPWIDVTDIFAYNGSHVSYENLFLRATGTFTYPDYGMIHGSATGATGWTGGAPSHCVAKNITFEQNGVDKVGCTANLVLGCRFQNSGSSASGSWPAILGQYGGAIVGCLVNGWRGSGIDFGGGTSAYGQFQILDSVVGNCRSATVPTIRAGVYAGDASRHTVLAGVTVYGGASDACEFHSALYGTDDTYDKEMIWTLRIYNCVFAASGGYGINFKNGSTALHNTLRGFIDHNGFYGNVSGRYNRLADGAHDVILSADPFTDAPGGDFTLNSAAGGGALIRDVAFPADFPSA